MRKKINLFESSRDLSLLSRQKYFSFNDKKILVWNHLKSLILWKKWFHLSHFEVKNSESAHIAPVWLTLILRMTCYEGLNWMEVKMESQNPSDLSRFQNFFFLNTNQDLDSILMNIVRLYHWPVGRWPPPTPADETQRWRRAGRAAPARTHTCKQQGVKRSEHGRHVMNLLRQPSLTWWQWCTLKKTSHSTPPSRESLPPGLHRKGRRLSVRRFPSPGDRCPDIGGRRPTEPPPEGAETLRWWWSSEGAVVGRGGILYLSGDQL